MFKLNRMDAIAQTGETVNKREVLLSDLSTEAMFSGSVNVKAVFDPSMKWNLIEEFGVNSFSLQQDGALLFEHEYTDRDNLIKWMLTCKKRISDRREFIR